MKEFLSKILELKRPEQITVTQYGRYTSRNADAVYDDDAKGYRVNRVSGCQTNLASKKSLVQFIKEELKRRDNITGKNASLRIGESGGSFIADDNFGEGLCSYKRINSQQWLLVRDLDGEVLNHETFLMYLLKLSPSIVDFKKTYASFLTVRKIGKSELVSNPVFVNNEAESGYLVKYKLEGGQGADDVIPDGFKLSVPFIKASNKKYDLDVDVQILNDNSNQLRIKINIPLLENIEEQAIIDEIEDIKSELAEQTDLLVLSDI